MAIDHQLEELMSHLGEFGRYQGFQFFLHILSAVCAGLHMLTLFTINAIPEHRCFIEGVDQLNASAAWNSTEILAAIPEREPGVLESCVMFVQGTETNETQACTSYVFDDTYYKDTRAIDWGMVCENRYRGAIAQTIYMLGVFTGAVVLGSLADKVGRKKVFCWSGTLQLILGVGVAFIPEYYTFLFIRYLYGIFGSAGAYITGFVLTMELVGPSKRTVCGVTFQAMFAGGIMLVAGWGALIKDRQLLQIVYGLHGLLLFGHWWWMDESPRWLWTQGRKEEAVDIVARGVKTNGRGVGIDKNHFLTGSKQQTTVEAPQPSAGLSSLFKTPKLRSRTLNVCLCWFANSIAYYGLSLNSGNLGGNPFMNLFIISLVEIPSYIAVILLLDRLGRRSITSSFMIVGGIACIAAVFMAQKSTESLTTIFLGKLLIAGSFAVIYNYSAELFPTVVRNSAMGLGSMCARLAGAFTPLITLLDSFDPKVPAIIFGAVSLISGIWVLFLPETNGQPMPESLEDGENFGKNDTCFTTCLGRRAVVRDEYRIPPEQQMVNINK